MLLLCQGALTDHCGSVQRCGQPRWARTSRVGKHLSSSGQSVCYTDPLLSSRGNICLSSGCWTHHLCLQQKTTFSLDLHLHLSHSLADCWGTTVDLTTNFLHSYWFSAFRSMILHSLFDVASPLFDAVFPSFPLSASSSPSLNCSL